MTPTAEVRARVAVIKCSDAHGGACADCIAPAIRSAEAAENEACAKVADTEYEAKRRKGQPGSRTATGIAAAIRARRPK